MQKVPWVKMISKGTTFVSCLLSASLECNFLGYQAGSLISLTLGAMVGTPMLSSQTFGVTALCRLDPCYVFSCWKLSKLAWIQNENVTNAGVMEALLNYTKQGCQWPLRPNMQKPVFSVPPAAYFADELVSFFVTRS